MRTFEEILEHSRKFDTYKDYLDHYNIIESSIEYEKDFFERESLTNYNSFYFFNKDYPGQIFERLGVSLSPQFVEDRLWDELGGYIEKIKVITNNRNDNVTLKITLDDEVFTNREYKREFRDELNEILHHCNWFIFFDPFEKTKEKRIQTNYYKIEPAKPENASRFIYEDCKGIIYRLLYYKGGYTEKKLKDILKNGLSPKHYKHEFENNLSNNRIYFIANTSEEKIKKDLAKLIEGNVDYKRHKDELKLIKIDLNKFKTNHNKTIECFIDPRMDLKCFWTMEFIPPSCIEDVTDKYKEYF